MKSVCLNHQDREATTRCAACLKPLCDECVVPGPEGSKFCSSECLLNTQQSGQRFTEFREREAMLRAAARKAALFRMVATLAILAALGLGFVMAWPTLPKAMKEPIIKFYKQIEARF